MSFPMARFTTSARARAEARLAIYDLGWNSQKFHTAKFADSLDCSQPGIFPLNEKFSVLHFSRPTCVAASTGRNEITGSVVQRIGVFMIGDEGARRVSSLAYLPTYLSPTPMAGMSSRPNFGEKNSAGSTDKTCLSGQGMVSQLEDASVCCLRFSPPKSRATRVTKNSLASHQAWAPRNLLAAILAPLRDSHVFTISYWEVGHG